MHFFHATLYLRSIGRNLKTEYTTNGGSAAKVHRRQKVNGKGGQEWTIRGQKSQRLQGIFDTKPRWMVLEMPSHGWLGKVLCAMDGA